MSELTLADVSLILSSKECWCGRAKFEKHAVCYVCWQKLGDDSKSALYMRGRAFIESYERAIEHLKKRTYSRCHVRRRKGIELV